MPTYFYGLKYIPTSIGALILNTNPIFVAIIALILLKEQITKVKIITTFGSFGGVALFLCFKDNEDKEYDNFLFGVLCSSI